MSRHNNPPVLAGCLGALLGAAAAHADEVVMANGDRLTGTVETLAGGTLTLATSYAGTISLSWAEVASIRTDAPIRVVLEDHTSLEARMLAGEEAGTVRLKSGTILESAPIGLARVAYINPPPEVTGEGVRLKGRLNVGWSVTNGNSETEQLYAEGEVVARTLSNRYTAGFLTNQASEDGTDTTSNTTAYTKYDHFVTEQWYGYANASFTEDEFKDLNLRSAAGVGAGYQFWETDERNLSLEGGLTYVNEDFIKADDEAYAAARWAVQFDHMLWQGLTRFFHEHEGLLGLEDTDDLVVRSRTGLRFPLADNFKATAQINVDWDNSPPPDTENVDTTYLFNLGYDW